MRLINAKVLVEEGRFSFEEFYHDRDVPTAYAILSHFWIPGQEITYENCNSEEAQHLNGYTKILRTCEQARSDALDYVWVDTCCIDKSSSAELTQAINSMFTWYQNATICYVFLADTVDRPINHSRWFKRGWTLQELIAPKSMHFFSRTWEKLGRKADMLDELSQITLVNRDVLSHESSLSSICVAQRLSWAANRETTRVEDEAYCLLGILDINMPLLYGEGSKAFYRLQEEVFRSTNDLSIFAWSPEDTQVDEYCGFFAQSSKDFAGCSTMKLIEGAALDDIPMSISSRGVEIMMPEYILESESENTSIKHQYGLKLNCKKSDTILDFLTVTMRKIGPNVFLRTRFVDTNSFEPEPVNYGENERKDFVLLTKMPKIGVPGNIVSFSRHTQVQIKFQGRMPKTETREMPTKAWDVQDHAFFGTGTSLQNWGAISFNDTAFFVCIWAKAGEDWTIDGFLLDRNSERMDRVWTDLFLYGETLGYRAPSVRGMLPETEGRQQGYLEFVDDSADERRFRKISFLCRPHLDLAVCSGPRWVVEIREWGV